MINESDLSSWLEATLLFQGLSQSEFIPLLQIAQLQKFSKGELIFEQGSEATGFFVVKTGRVKVFKMALTGKEQILNIFEPGENFAEVATLDGKPFPASAATLEAAELIFFPRMLFLDLLHQYPNIAIKMLISVSQHSRHLAEVIEELSFKDVPQRLAAYLLNLTNKSSTPANIVTLDLTKSQLAATLGTIPETLSRTLHRLSSEGLIAVNGSQIKLLDRLGLQKLSK